ncbi:MAG: SIS domain-containing protein [Alphaproteobacteria bacterium]|nr:SIS domain-containing protein [Alphaproteobacteria bacterium]MBO6863513.1 SIS domain-containing protein [Alphaproteobacteria bacterium]
MTETALTPIATYAETVSALVRDGVSTDRDGAAASIDNGLATACRLLTELKSGGGVLRIVGNGGSAAIASHMSVDFSKRGGIAAVAHNDAGMLTCLSNDLGYDQVYAHQIGLHGRAGDLLIAISSSGRSANILNACNSARDKGMKIVTLSGFKSDNPLRRLGDVNFYIASEEYGPVELSHMMLLSAAIDMLLGWNGPGTLKGI